MESPERQDSLPYERPLKGSYYSAIETETDVFATRLDGVGQVAI